MQVLPHDPIVTDLDATLLVEAAAGTGKTTALVRRIVRLVGTGRARIQELVAVTFSEKAAGELKLRLREALELARADPDAATSERERFTDAIYGFEEAHLNTIHGFCAELLRERPVEALVDPDFVVLTEGQASALLDEAFSTWLQTQLADPQEGLRRSLRRTSPWHGGDGDENGPTERLRKAAAALAEWRDHDAAWQRPEFDRSREIDTLAGELRAFAELTAQPLKADDPFAVATAPARSLSQEIERTRHTGGDRDVWEAGLVALASRWSFAKPKAGYGKAFAAGVSRDAARDAHRELVAKLQRFQERADADLAARLREELRDCLCRYQALKASAGALDFLDLLIKARDLVRDHPDVRRTFQRRFRFLMVDEFQDTDPLQSELLLLLAGDNAMSAARNGALFVVGDPKQSIYRFRRADVLAYAQVRDRLVCGGASRVTLATSYRAVPSLQAFVNAAFSPVMTGDTATAQADYVPLRPHRGEAAGQPSVVVLPVPRPYGTYGVTDGAMSESQPDAVAEFVRWLVSEDCGWTVEGLDPGRKGRRRIAASDICLLFRRFNTWRHGERLDVTRGYLEAFEARGVPHLLVGGRSFYEREEIDALRNALTAIEWPEDELSVFATLRGPLFAIDDEQLLEYHFVAQGFHPYRVPAERPASVEPVAQALALLRNLHAQRNHRPVADTVGRLLAETRAHAGLVLWQGGEQVLANVLYVGELARRYEADGGLSFRGFVEVLRAAAAQADAPEAPMLEEGSDGVRVMTVHKAKGLEFPVVILADLGCKMTHEQASRFVDAERHLCALRLGSWSPLELLEHGDEEVRRDEAEGVRLAYVAATRARDLLVMPAVGDAPFEKSWLHPLDRALRPQLGARQTPEVPVGCPPFRGRDTVLERPDGQHADASTVRPGAYRFAGEPGDAGYTVVWWDPLLLDAPADDVRGLRREDLVTKDADPLIVAADRGQLEAWRERRAQVLARSQQPSTKVVTVSEWAREADDETVSSRPREAASAVTAEEGAVEVFDTGAGTLPRPAGRRFGILVHALLAHLPLDAGAAEIETHARTHGRLLDATDEEERASIDAVRHALAHPLLERCRAAQRAGREVRREVALTFIDGDLVVDGQADLAWNDGERWMVVDFKTDALWLAAEAGYRRQLAAYVRAIARATGKPVRGALLRV